MCFIIYTRRNKILAYNLGELFMYKNQEYKERKLQATVAYTRAASALSHYVQLLLMQPQHHHNNRNSVHRKTSMKYGRSKPNLLYLTRIEL